MFNYKTIEKFVFNEKSKNSVVKFILVYVIVFLVNISVIKIFRTAGYNDYISGVFAIITASVVSFVLNKLYVFKGNKNERKTHIVFIQGEGGIGKTSILKK